MDRGLIDLTNFLDFHNAPQTKTVVSCVIRLDKKTMLNILQAESLFINGEYYKVPEQTILELLLKKKYGDTHLELERIDSKPL